MNPAIDAKVRVAATRVTTPTPVFICDVSGLHSQLLLARQAIDELRISHPSVTTSNVKSVYMSPWKSHRINAKLLPLCQSAITIGHYCAQQLGADLHSLNLDLTVTDCWGAIYETADRTLRHNHFPAEFAMVTYLEADPNCAPIVFGGEVAVQPKPGQMIVFPGILDHEVPATEGRRVIVAMNLHKRSTFQIPAQPTAQPQGEPVAA